MQFQELNVDTAEYDNVGGIVRNFRIATDFGTFDFSEGPNGIQISLTDGRILIIPVVSNCITLSAT